MHHRSYYTDQDNKGDDRPAGALFSCTCFYGDKSVFDVKYNCEFWYNTARNVHETTTNKLTNAKASI